LSDLVERGPLRLQLDATMDAAAITGGFDVQRDPSLDGSAHQSCN